MYAVFESGGLQFRAEVGAQIRIPHLDANRGDKVTFDKVLMVNSEKKGSDSLIGSPYLEAAKIEAEVVAEGRAEKIDVYKFKRRTKYRKLRGHRQQYTEVKIKKINSPKN
jgi:large subunit ribosomal protein L21